MSEEVPPIDLDIQEGISSIQNIISHKNKFYILANKKDGKLGFYLISLDADKPKEPVKYLISWSNKLDIGCCDMNIMKEKDGSVNIVVSYKMININTYNIFVIDLQHE